MTIYHGGFSEIQKPEILEPKRTLDFGSGFYATTSFEQAKKWAITKKDRFHFQNEQGFLGKEELLKELRTWKYVDQFCFHTEKSLKYLQFKKSEEIF